MKRTPTGARARPSHRTAGTRVAEAGRPDAPNAAAVPGGHGAATGTYRYDKALGGVVKVSDSVPGISRKRGNASVDSGTGGCGRARCGGGSCAMRDGAAD